LTNKSYGKLNMLLTSTAREHNICVSKSLAHVQSTAMQPNENLKHCSQLISIQNTCFSFKFKESTFFLIRLVGYV